ncbi:MAG: CheR family methyltransferase [Myxococcota bacterium]
MNVALDRAALDQLRTLVGARLGLDFGDDRLEQLSLVASKRMEKHRLARLEDYLALFDTGRDSSAEVAVLAEELTVGETFFFRGEEHFRVLTELLLQEQHARGRHARILSAGCASGEEPYSLAIALREALPEIDSWKVWIDALDVNAAVLAKARAARYSAWSLRATSNAIKERYFEAQGRDFVLDPRVRSMVHFEQRSLAEEWPPLGGGVPYDAIFCRNVIMYFRVEVARRVLLRFEQALRPDGFLFLGHAETLRGLSQDYHLCHSGDAFYYQRRSGEQQRAPASDSFKRSGFESELSRQLPQIVDDAPSWVDAIQNASRKILRLTTPEAGKPVASAETPPSWDLQAILAMIHQERFGEALEQLRALPDASQRDAEVLLLLAVILTNKGASEDAEAACRRLLEVDELNAGAHYLLALCREHAADAEGAVECDRTAIYLDPSFAMPHLHLGLLAKRNCDTSLAKRELSQARRLLDREDAARVVLFGGGFSRQALVKLCDSELAAVEASS